MFINIEILKSFNNLEKGSKYTFDFSDRFYYLIVGKNGCGKSSLLNAIRSTKCDNADTKLGDWERKVGYVDIAKYKGNVNIDTDFEKIFFLSSEFDDPLSLNNAASANSFIANGGYASRNKSNGEKSMQLLGKWMNENEKDFNGKTLIVLDEVDKGFDIRYQSRLLHLIGVLNKKHGVKCLVISHHSLPILLADKIYDFENKRLTSSAVYLMLNTEYIFEKPKKWTKDE